MMDAELRIALADDSYLMREAIGQVLGGLDGIDVAAVCGDGDSLLDAVDREEPDVVVTDLRMPPAGDGEGIRVAHRLRETHPQIGVVVLSQFAEPHHGAALMANGAEGRAYLLEDRVHDSEELRTAIEIVARGGSMIDPRMLELLLSAQGRSHDSPLTRADAAGARRPGRHGRGEEQRGDRTEPRRDDTGRGKARRLDLPQAGAPGRIGRQQARCRRSALSRRGAGGERRQVGAVVHACSAVVPARGTNACMPPWACEEMLENL